MGVLWLGKEEISPWEMVPHRGKLFVTTADGLLLWEIIPTISMMELT